MKTVNRTFQTAILFFVGLCLCLLAAGVTKAIYKPAVDDVNRVISQMEGKK